MFFRCRRAVQPMTRPRERIGDVDLRVDRLTAEMRRGFADVRAEVRRLHEADDRLAESDEDLRRRLGRRGPGSAPELRHEIRE